MKIRGVKEANVCIWDGKDDYHLVETNRFGFARVKLKSDPKEYQIAVSAKGHNIHYQDVLVLPVSEKKTVAAFKKYIESRARGLSDEQLDMIAEAVDRNGDGLISDEEFANRMESIQAAMKPAEDEQEQDEQDDR